ncbi:MAG TPA: hypothetical protein VKV05_06615, partial [Terriglobales bacterium]|nr:hypothetical protein [Terriglobales bacterium]
QVSSVTMSDPTTGEILAGGREYIGSYTVTGSAEQVSAALRSLNFYATPNELLSGQTVNTDFTITANDGTLTTTDSTTSVIAYLPLGSPLAVGSTPQHQVVESGAPFSHLLESASQTTPRSRLR